MEKTYYLTFILFVLLSSCDKKSDLYYSSDTEIGLQIKNKNGKDLLDSELVVEKISFFGNNIGGESPTGGRLTPDTPPINSFQIRKTGNLNTLYFSFAPMYKESTLTIKWRNVVQEDTLKAELYNKSNTVYPRKIYYNGNLVWTDEQKGDIRLIQIKRDF